MSLIKNIETKMKLSLWLGVGCMMTAIVIVAIGLSYARKIVSENKNQIYVLDKNGIPFQADLTNVKDNRKVEYIDAIKMYHYYFFNLPPDNDFINEQLNKAMYLVDASGVAQYNTLKEKGYFSSLVATSAISTCTVDSVKIDMKTKHWILYGKQKLQRPSMITIRNLITEGYLQDIPRSINNPHGVLLSKWRTINNKDISNESVKTF